ncbi:hypothetical protein NQ318_018708 [Aromia moschata]|uniref:Glucosylceramidase n=1 Tax=Aromia moschata TaxID=1265417 RepID=A0AAV8ZIS9_9CUCU|nr:hypothetical protein NQ318_018708 [Aromia moschata]
MEDESLKFNVVCIFFRPVKMISILILATVLTQVWSEDCNVRSFPTGTVCVCNATYCDTVPKLDVSTGKYQVYTTSKSKLGFYSEIAAFANESTEDAVTVTVDRSKKFQTILGFGGAFTDATGINICSLSQEAQENLLESYFSENGIEYSLCRVPIGGTDFSTRGYSYDDHEGDVTLELFELQQDDIDYKIPYILKSKKLTNDQLKLFASPWTAPAWMKTNKGWAGIGFLETEYYQVWADYIVKFFDEYEKHNISFWGMTLQNEGINGFVSDALSRINAMAWLPAHMNKWIVQNIGPSIRKSAHKDLKIMVFDDNREALFLLHPLLNNETVMSYVDGIAVHWYWNWMPISLLDVVKPYLDTRFLLPTEACNGDGNDISVVKGSWERGVKYINDIIVNLQYGASGWVDWNMALDENGGPTYIDNYVDSPVIVNKTLQEFYKQPMFYALGHFSKFIRPGSVRLDASITGSDNDLKAVAFLRPDNLIALVVFNK